jgi:hypothetical protein
VGVVDDDFVHGDELLTIVGSSQGFDVSSPVLWIRDDDLASLDWQTGADSLSVEEAGNEAEIEFSLTAAPTSEVLIHLQTSLDRVELTQESLVFNAETWDVPQVVGVRALADWSVDAQVDFLITAVFDAESNSSAGGERSGADDNDTAVAPNARLDPGRRARW